MLPVSSTALERDRSQGGEPDNPLRQHTADRLQSYRVRRFAGLGSQRLRHREGIRRIGDAINVQHFRFAIRSERFLFDDPQFVTALVRASKIRQPGLRDGVRNRIAVGQSPICSLRLRAQHVLPIYQGTPLPELIQESQLSLNFSRTRVNQWAIDLLEGGLKIFASLSACTSGPDVEEAWETDYLRQVDEHHNVQVKCIYLELRAFSLLMFGQFERALAWSDKVEPLIYTVGTQGLLPWPEHVFSRALIISALYPDATRGGQAIWHVELQRTLEQLEIWSASCPENFAHKYALVAGEFARLNGRIYSAIRFYHQSAVAAAGGGFLQWEGLANERAAAFFEKCGQGRLASVYWQQAYSCYHRWGATGKLQAMETDYCDFLSIDIQGVPKLNVEDKVLDHALLSELLEKQLHQLRMQSAGLDYASLQQEFSLKSQELAEGTERLRVEVAERKRAEQLLQQHREHLEEIVQQRTAELEASRNQLIEAREAALNLMKDAIVARDNSEAGRIALELEVAERKKMMDALITSEREFHLLAEAMPQIVWITRPDGWNIYFNQQWVDYTGLTLEEGYGHGWNKPFHPDDRQRAWDAWQNAVNNHGVYSLECRLRRADGAYRWWLVRGEPAFDENGKIYKWFGTCTDIEDLKIAENELLVAEGRLNLALEFSEIGVWELDSNHDSAWRSLKHDQIFGYESLQPEWGFGTAMRHVVPEDRVNFSQCFEAARNTGKLFLECRIIQKDQSLRWINAQGRVLYDEKAQPLRMLGTVVDITERKMAEREMVIASTIFDSQEGMIVADADGLILRVNPAFTRITGYTQEEVIRRNPRVLKSGRHDADFYQAFWASVNHTGSWKGEIWNRRKSGEIYPQYLTITAVKDISGNVTNYVSTFNDISLNKATEEEIRNLAFFDPLTDLPNRRLLMDRLKQALASSQRSGKEGALLFLDLDNFKAINDTLGHDTGDQLLQQVAERLTGCVREGDTVARLGGDEFVVMLEDLSEQAMEAAAQTEAIAIKILNSLNQPYQLGDYKYNNTPSIGITLFNSQEILGQKLETDELLKQADIAMYQAKNSGRNGIRFFDPQMEKAVIERVTMESDLRLAQAGNQFRLYYQMQIDKNGKIIGAEALIRWQHPDHGLVSPIEFIPLAEETGLILPIGQWILETACGLLKAWQQNEMTNHLVLSINVSAKQFHQPGFVAQVQSAVQRYAIQPGLLKLELTESMLLNDIEGIIVKMTLLKEIGILFSMDDFGTGYSSLAYLSQLPLNQLKIDKSFVRNLASKSMDIIIVRTIIGMAKNLGIEVIAEGVETEEQRELLELNGCDFYQGFLFGEPVPLPEFERLIDQRGQSLRYPIS